MSDLIASSIALSFGAHQLFADVSLEIGSRDRIALVGPNGAGKTTLLRVLSQQITPDAGSLRIPNHIKVALHDQRPERSSVPLKEFVAPARFVELEASLRSLELQMASGDEAVFREYETVRAQFDALGGEAWVHECEAIVRGLGFQEHQLHQPLDSLSGGELTRASLARALSGRPDILLLDEPTNHLDIESIEWLQDYLIQLPGGCVIVSHDRWFIEATCTSVVEVVDGKARRFTGSFVEYRTQQALEAATHMREVEKWQTEMSRLQRFVDRFSAGTRSKQAQSRVKALEKLRNDVPQYSDLRSRRGLSFKLPKPERSGATVFDVRGIELGFSDESGTPTRTLLKPENFVVERGEKIALLGRNGMGKSTLLHALAAACIPLVKSPDGYRGGDVRMGYNTHAHFISQHDAELRDDWTLIANVTAMAASVGRGDAMSLLGLFGFSAGDAERKVKELSGGERRRLLLAMALTGTSNLLMLDEPTNHLDLESREGLEAALTEFDGTVIFISHDRALIEGVATRLVVLHEQELKSVLGTVEDAQALMTGVAAAPSAEEAALPVKPSSTPSTSNKKRTATSDSLTKAVTPTGSQASTSRTIRGGKKASRFGNERKSGNNGHVRIRRPATIEREITELETRMSEVNEQMLDPDVYTDPEKAADALSTHATLERDIAARYTELEASLEHFG